MPRKPISFRATVLATSLTGFYAAESNGRSHFVYSNRLPQVGARVIVRALWDGRSRFYVYASTGTTMFARIGRTQAAVVAGSVGSLDRSNHRFLLLLDDEQVTPVSYVTKQTPSLLKAAARPRAAHVIRLRLHGQRWQLSSIR